MSRHPFHSFIDLVDFDLKIVELHNRVAGLRAQLESVAQRVASLKKNVSDAKERAISARKQVDSLELELKELDARQKEKKAQLNDLSKYKEYKSLQKEFELLQGAENEKEAELLIAWNVLELAQAVVGVQEKALQQETADFEQAQKSTQHEIESVEKELRAAEGERAPKEKLVPAEWLEKYMVMRSRIADPVVVVHNGSCSACFEDLTNQEMIRLNQGALLQCKGCYRFLYAKDAMQHQNILEN